MGGRAMAYAEDIFGDGIGREITVLVPGDCDDRRVVAGILIDIDGDTLMIHDHGPLPGRPAEHVCVPGMCVFPIAATEVSEAILGALVAM